jgi:hypothetical protein
MSISISEFRPGRQHRRHCFVREPGQTNVSVHTRTSSKTLCDRTIRYTTTTRPVTEAQQVGKWHTKALTLVGLRAPTRHASPVRLRQYF